MLKKQKSLIICGNYGASNLGDEAILAGLIVLIRSTFPDARITAMSSDLNQTRKSHQIEAISYFPAGFRSFFRYIFSSRGWQSYLQVRRADLILLGGGGLFADENPRAVWIWFVQFLAFWLMGKKVFCIAQSVGPLHSNWGKGLTKFVFRRAVAITVRDQQSQKLLQALGIKNVKVLADPAYALAYDMVKPVKLKNQLVLSLRPWKTHLDLKISAILAELIVWLRHEHDLETVFVPFQSDHVDDRIRYDQIKKLLGKNAAGFQLLPVKDFRAAMGVIAESEMVIGMRLHSIIFALLARTPFVALSYSKKVKDFVETVALDDYVLDYEKLTLKHAKNIFAQILRQKGEITQSMEKSRLHYAYEFFHHEELLKSVCLDVD